MQNKFDGCLQQMLVMDFRVSNKIFGQEMNKISQYRNPLASATVLLCELRNIPQEQGENFSHTKGVCRISLWLLSQELVHDSQIVGRWISCAVTTFFSYFILILRSILRTIQTPSVTHHWPKKSANHGSRQLLPIKLRERIKICQEITVLRSQFLSGWSRPSIALKLLTPPGKRGHWTTCQGGQGGWLTCLTREDTAGNGVHYRENTTGNGNPFPQNQMLKNGGNKTRCEYI